MISEEPKKYINRESNTWLNIEFLFKVKASTYLKRFMVTLGQNSLKHI